MASLSDNIPLIVIAGETASGKSDLGMAVAERCNGEIISADSWSVYPGFDIGTAKPKPDERARVPHHLLDIADPREGFSAAVFQRLALRAIQDIGSRRKVPIMVGGSGLYVDSVVYGYSFLPSTSDGERQRLNTLSLPQLCDLAARLGLDMSGIDIRNKRRVIRLIENRGARPTKESLRPRTLMLGLSVPSPDVRIDNITRRVDVMLGAGLEQEALQLAHQYGWEAEPMKGIGYREWRDYAAGLQTLAHTRERIIQSTLQLAKKQRTWFLRNEHIRWVNTGDNIVDIVTTYLNN